MTMRPILVALAFVAGTSAASAEVWFSREGTCGEWRSRWSVEQEQSGIWIGSIDQVHVGGPCGQGNGSRVRSEVHAAIVGETFFAMRQTPTGYCSYYGRIREDRARGVELCETGAGAPSGRWTFALRFPPEGGREARQRSEQRPAERPDDDWLDDPQTLDRDRPPPGFNFEFRRGPRQ